MENSFQLIKKLKGKYFESDYILVSLDVISLFINVPIDLAQKSIIKRWNYIANNTKITQEEFDC